MAGRKPIGEQPLSPTERQQRWRSKQRAASSGPKPVKKRVALSLNETLLNQVDELASSMSKSRTETIEILLAGRMKEADRLLRYADYFLHKTELDADSQQAVGRYLIDHIRLGGDLESFAQILDGKDVVDTHSKDGDTNGKQDPTSI